MARTVRTPGTTEEPTEEAIEEAKEPIATEQENEQMAGEQVSHSGETEDFMPAWAVAILDGQKRIENKLDALAAEAGLKITKPPRFKFDPAKGHVME